MKIRNKSILYSVTVIMLFLFGASLHPVFSQESQNVVDKVRWTEGPDTASLDEWAQIDVSNGYVFADADDTRMLMEAMGNLPSNQEVGFLAPNSLAWFVVFEFDEVGYIKDDEKDDLDEDAILKQITEGTEQGNKRRREMGFPGLTIIGWEITPQYNETTHNLEWAIRAEDDNGEPVLNHNTRILGRKGVMKATLVVDPQSFDHVFPDYSAALEGFSFKEGHRYAEYVKGDKLAKYGLTALVAGGAGAAAAKFGLFKFLGKFGKWILIGIAVFFGSLWRKIKGVFTGGNRTKRDNIPYQ